MNKSIYSIALLYVVISCGGSGEENITPPTDTTKTTQDVVDEPEIVNSFVLETGTVGIFHIGAPISELPEVLNSRVGKVNTSVNGKAVEHDAFIIFNSMEDVAELILIDDSTKTDEERNIVEMKVIADYYETAEGIKVGSLVTEFGEKYTDAGYRYSSTSGEIIAETTALAGVEFIIDPAGCTKKIGKTDLTLTASNFNETASIKYIRVK
ncbi:MAG: hypothetical protein IPM74_17690 [Crocinitomicaceae bacterium]|nr:hypothetical protein [Crocinitomicaceae bacterium]MBK8927680.1 hypothetical protein [Crocinitomicaceae bacterium]